MEDLTGLEWRASIRHLASFGLTSPSTWARSPQARGSPLPARVQDQSAGKIGLLAFESPTVNRNSGGSPVPCKVEGHQRKSGVRSAECA